MILTVCVYFSILFLLFFCGRISSIRYNRFGGRESFLQWEIWFPIIVFAIIFGLRYDVGTDHLRYLDAYKTGDGIQRYEPIFLLITNCFRNNDFHPAIYFAFLASIQITCVYYALKGERYLMPFVAVSLICGQFFIHWMNGIRQDLAGCIFFFAVNYIIDKRFGKYFLCCVIATGFHKSAIILLLLYPFLKPCKDLTFNRLFQFVIMFASFLVMLTKKDFLSFLFPVLDVFAQILGFDVYSESVIETFTESTKAGNGISVILFFLIDTIIIFYSDKLKNAFNDKRFITYYNLYYWGAVFQLFFTNNLLLARPFRYFRLFKMIIIAYLLFYLLKKKFYGLNKMSAFMILGMLFLLLLATIKNEPFYFM